MIDKIKKRLKQVGVLGIILIVLAVVFAPSKEEAEAQKKEKITALEAELKTISKNKPYENLIRYQALLELDPANKNYQDKVEYYKTKETYAINCRELSRKLDKKALKIESSYGSESKRFTVFKSDTQIYTTNEFKGSNLVGQEHTFKSEYYCTINKDNTLTVKSISFKRVN